MRMLTIAAAIFLLGIAIQAATVEPPHLSNSMAAPSSFVAHDTTVLRDAVSGLLWTRSDNGSDINWNDAKDYCTRLPDMRLPTLEELGSLYDPKRPEAKCGEYNCKGPEQFQLSGPSFWSSRSDGPFEAWVIYLTSDFRHATNRRESITRRALCVRRP